MGTHESAADTATVEVLIVDDQPPFREVARTLVSLLPHWRVVAEAETGEEAVAGVARYAPSLVLMDINLPGISGIEATRRIMADSPDVRVVLLSTYAVDDLPADALNCGAVAYLHKEDLTPRRLREVVTQA
ncbi:MAG TPA: response regulator transcription factor [Jatrophihabitans sp.]|jgi:DNA-binding NarL/FixJ family response regulator|nr:response regulator transcription factor [Jatrophihabitans sp.]